MAVADGVEKKPLHPLVKKLDDKIKTTPGWTKLFEDAVQSARKTGIVEMQTIHTLSDWIDSANEFLYWIPREGEEGRDVYYRICLFYFVVNQPTVKPLQDPIKPEAINKKDSWLTEWLHDYAAELGKWHDDPGSISEIQTFKDSKPYNMKEYIEPRGGWRDFNDFFVCSIRIVDLEYPC